MTTEQFDSGAVRDSQDGKVKFDLITPTFKHDLAAMLTDKGEHYGDRNWEKGIPTARTFSSLLRHIEALGRGEWLDGESGHPHTVLAAANLMFIHEFHGTNFDTLHECVGPALRNENSRDETIRKAVQVTDIIYFDDDEPSRSTRWRDPEGDVWYWDTEAGKWTYVGVYDPWDWDQIDQKFFPMERVK